MNKRKSIALKTEIREYSYGPKNNFIFSKYEEQKFNAIKAAKSATINPDFSPKFESDILVFFLENEIYSNCYE